MVAPRETPRSCVPSVGDLIGPYGASLAAKTAALVAPGAAGTLQRRHLRAVLAPRYAFARPPVAEVMVLSVTSGVAAVLSGTPTCADGARRQPDATTALLGYPHAGGA